MRLASLSLLLVLPLLAACDNSPKAPTGNAAAPAKPAATKPAATVPATFPLGARPMLGTWAADVSACADPALVTTVSATSWDVGGKSCELALKDNKDGTFAATCGKQNMTLTPIFGPTGEGIRVAAGEGKPTNVFRCRR
ncbi:hypothetical protein PRN20_20725 [Devosia sp. ZB163]|uniref:hypothetical protein n=1 Tax=Devosia sp. ZB163 TaxID=3025938 RepID=UPI00235F35D7|nr:hypothetical protein [Devosia sp. ZB163]MDC9826166.1 hypothetical protein [Devosia sp. ZB163]